MSTPTAQIKVTLETAQAESDAKSFSETLLGAITPTIDVADLASQAWNTLKDVVSASVGAAIEAQSAEARLTAALRERGIATDEVVGRMNAYNTAIASGTGISDEALLGIQSQLVALGANTDALAVATRATLGLSEVSGKDLASATQMVGRVMGGNIDILKKYNIHAKDVADALEQLASKSEITSDAGQTTQGRIDRLTNAVGELGEALGFLILSQKDGVGWMDRLLDKARHFTVGITDAANRAREFAEKNLGVNVELDGMVDRLIRAQPVMGNFMADMRLAAIDMIDFGKETEDAAIALALLTEKQEAKALVDAEASRKRLEDMRLIALAAGSGGAVTAALFGDEGSEIKARSKAEQARDAADAKRARAEAMTEVSRNAADNIGGGLNDLVGQLDTERQIVQDHKMAMLEVERNHRERMLAITDGANKEQARIDEEEKERQKRSDDDYEKSKDAFFGRMIQGGIALASSLGASMGQAAASGESAGVVMQRFGGQVISMIGNTLIQLGTAAIVAGAIGTAAPWLFGITGGPAAVAAGAAAVVVGTGLVALGSYVSGSAGSKAGKAAGKGSGGGSSARTQADDTSGFTRGKESVSNVFNVNFMGGIYGGDPRKLGRELRDLIGDSMSLTPTRGRG